MATEVDPLRDVPVPGAAVGNVAARAGSVVDFESLAARCQALWRQGDWHSLAEYGVGDVESHPQRASLALMVAAAHQALGQAGQTRLYVDLARQWGCAPQMIAGALIAGVHNTLGRAVAAAGKQRHRALRHFVDAVAAGGGSGLAEVRLHERVRCQLSDMRLDSDVPWLLEGAADRAPGTLQSAAPSGELVETLRRSSELTLIRLKEQSQQLVLARRAIEDAVRKETGNAVRQLEAHANLQRYLSEEQVVPQLHGWPVSPDFAVLLIEMVESNNYDLVIEFGSGTSTLLMAIALARTAKRRQRSTPAVQVAFEHLGRFHQQTHALLDRAGVAGVVQLELAELRPWQSAQGTEYLFYACQDKLHAIVHAMSARIPKVLVVVDGPPAATGKHARYPALPIVLDCLKGAAMDVVLDDHARPEEQEISKMWLTALEAARRRTLVVTHPLEKGACVLVVEAT